MDKVTLDGKTYEKSAVVAKRYGYTADYLGQLSRAEKVDAQLVGRSWYVHAPSVKAYQAGLEDEASAPESSPQPTSPDETSKTTESSESGEATSDGNVTVVADNRSYPVETHAGADEKSFISRLSRLDEEDASPPSQESPQSPPAPAASQASKPSPAKPQPAQPRARSRFSPAEPAATTSHWQKVAYEKDDGALVPDVNKACAVPPVHELGKKVRVHSNTDKFSIVTSAMPEVPLRGAVAVQGVDDASAETLSLHYQEANTRIRQQLTALEPQHHRQSQPTTTASAPTTPAPETAPAEPAPTTTPVRRSALLVWISRLAWTATVVLFLAALASLFVAGEATYGEARGSTFGLVFAPADWFLRIWPF